MSTLHPTLDPVRLTLRQRHAVADVLERRAPPHERNDNGMAPIPRQVRANHMHMSMLHLADLYRHCERFYG